VTLTDWKSARAAGAKTTATSSPQSNTSVDLYRMARAYRTRVVAMKRLGVLGWPVGHSRSPAMHRAALAELGMSDWSYQLLPVTPELFDDTVRGLEAQGFVGANVTIPHKEAALAIADSATDDARAIGAANTLSFAGGKIAAANTDAPGFMAAIGEIAPATAMVLGAGGSARAVVYALEQAGTEVSIWNRTKARATELGNAVDEPVGAEMLVNCTSLGLGDPSSDFKALPVSVDALATYATVVDLVYRQDGDTELVANARKAGCSVIDGLEILVRQGALSFEIWTGQEAPIEVMRDGASVSKPVPHDDPGTSPTSARSRSGSREPGPGS
jgi:shikimate dehydrogenase